jgi:hypothetical protein
MSVLLTPVSPQPQEADETINISNGQWAAICAAAQAFGINVTPPKSHDQNRYSAETLRQMADRIEQLKGAPEWLRWLADCGGADLG